MTPETMPPLIYTAHMIYFLKQSINGVYIYDSADDGPEVEVITRILAADWYYEIEKESAR